MSLETCEDDHEPVGFSRYHRHDKCPVCEEKLRVKELEEQLESSEELTERLENDIYELQVIVSRVKKDYPEYLV